jgi:dUTP pyrophosphatase
MPCIVPLKRYPHSEGLPLPAYATPQSAGADLLAAIDKDIILKPGKRVLVPTGIAIALPNNFEAQIRPRSGLALKNGITCLNTPGTIDADYRGEINVLLVNLGQESFTLTRGMRIAQLILAPVVRAAWSETALLDETTRGSGGFGSTGTTG